MNAKNISIFLLIALSLQLASTSTLQAKNRRTSTVKTSISSIKVPETKITNTIQEDISSLESYYKEIEEIKKILQNTYDQAKEIIIKTYDEGISQDQIESICKQTSNPDQCINVVNQSIEFINDVNIQENIENINTAAQQSLQRTIISLQIQIELLKNNIGENKATDLLTQEINQIQANQKELEEKYNELIKLISSSIETIDPATQDQITSEKEKIDQTAESYIEILENTFKKYPEYKRNTNLTLHYLKGLRNKTTIKNHTLYNKDILSTLEIIEKHYGINTSSAQDIILDSSYIDENGNQLTKTGTINQTIKILPLIKENNENWFQSYFDNSDKLHQKTKSSQTLVNAKLVEVIYREVLLAREICSLTENDHYALCSYAYGTAIKAFQNDESVINAVCEELPDPETCHANVDLLKQAAKYSNNQDEDKVKEFIDFIAENKIPEEQYNALIYLFDMIFEAIKDEKLNEYEKETIKKTFILLAKDSTLLDQKIENALSKICKNQEDPSQCGEFIQDLASLGIDLYHSGASSEEALQAIINELKGTISFNNPQSIQNALNKLDQIINQSLIFIDFENKQLQNRNLKEYTNHLNSDYELIFSLKSEIEKQGKQIVILMEEIDQIAAEIKETKEIEQIIILSKKLLDLTEQLASISADFLYNIDQLEQYYNENYIPNTYSANSLVLNHSYEKNLKKINLSANNNIDILTIINPYSEQEELLNEIRSEMQDIEQLSSDLTELIPQTNEDHKNLLLSENPKDYLDTNPVKSQQEILNQGMKALKEIQAIFFYSLIQEAQELLQQHS